MLKRIAAFTFLFALAFVCVVVAQEAPPPLPVGETPAQELVIGVFSLVLPFIVGGIRKIIPGLPKLVIYSIPIVVGGVVGYIGTLGLNGWKGLAVGLIAIALHQFKEQVQKAVSPAPLVR
jgi:hypothetical protein